MIKGNHLAFIKVARIPATALVEPTGIKGYPSVEVVPAVYQGQDKIAILNLAEEPITLKKGTQVGTAHMTKVRTKQPDKPSVNIVEDENKEDILKQLFEDLKLDENEMLKDNPENLAKVKSLVTEYRDIFTSPEVAMGKTNLMEFEINLEPDAVQTSRFHHTILPTVAGSFFISRAVFKYIRLPPYFLAFHGQNNAFCKGSFQVFEVTPLILSLY